MNGAICRQGGHLLFSYFHHRTYIQYRPDIGCHTCFQKSPKSHSLQTPPNTTPLQMNQYHPYHKLYAPYPLPPQKTPICNFLDHPQKTITSKIQPYLKVVECLPFADWDEPSNRNPYEHFTSSAFWYWVSSQYFADCHLAADKRLQLRRQTANKVSDLVNGVVIKERVDRKRGNKAVGSQQWRTQELRTKTDMACSFVQYYYYIEKPRKYYPETSYAKVSYCGEVSSSLEDFQFINSTVISVVNILLRKMEEQSSFNSVVKFMLQNVELDQRSVKVKRSQILCLDELNTAESREQKMQAQQQQVEIKLDFYQIVRNIVYEMPLDVIIGFLQDQIPPYSLPGLDQPEHHLEQLYCDQQDTYNFVGTHSALDDQWIQIKKQQEKERMSREYSIENIDNANKRERKHIKQEDLPCQVCFEGDYEQQNLIMICSLCNIAIHQNCIYVEKVPDNNWICAVCQVFGPAGINLPCPLCPLKGGAMLKTTLRADRFVSHSRHFQKYFSRLSPKQNQSQYVTEQMRARPDIPLLYHYFQEETYPTIEPIFYEVWVHYSCTTLHNEPFFSSIDGQIIVQGVQNIPVQKYGRFCVLCGKSDGVTAKCREEDCNHNYHAECASRIKLVYQQADKENIIYKVFCPQHRPFEVELMLQSRRRKARDQIKKFASRVVKCLGQQKFPHRLPVISEKKQSKTSKKDSMEKSLASQGSKVKKQRSCRFKEQPEVDVASVRLKIKKEVENQLAIRQDLKFFNAVYAELQKKFFGLQNYDMKQIVGHQNSFFETLRLPTAFWKAFETSQRSDAQASQKFNSLMKKNAQLYSKIQYLKKLMKKKVKKTQSQLKRMRKVQPHQLEIEQNKQQKEDNIEPTARSRHQKQQESPLDLEQVERLGRNRNKQRTYVKRYHTPEKKVKKQEQAVKQQQPIIKQHPIIKQQTTIRQQKVKKQKSKKSKKSKKTKKIKKKYINKNQQKKQVMAQQEKKQAVELKKQETNKKIEQKQLPKSQGEKVKKMNGLQAMEQNRFKSRKQQQSNRNLRRVTASNISQVTYCICQQPWNPNSSRPMIECERCREWFHFSCIGMVNRKETETLSFICEICLGVQTKKTRVKYLKSYVQFFKPSSSILRAYHNDFAGDRSGQKKVRQN